MQRKHTPGYDLTSYTCIEQVYDYFLYMAYLNRRKIKC